MSLVSNADLLTEIHKCKNSFCFYSDPSFADYDAIVEDSSEITPEFLAGIDRPYPVIRVMTADHVPLLQEGETNRRRRNADRTKTNFPPFEHWQVSDTGLVLVGRSHWKGDLATGHFSIDHGRLSNKLGMMLLTLATKLGQKGNYRGYSYVDEMVASAVVQLCTVALQFDEHRSNNPFAWYTTVASNTFIRTLNSEKSVQNLRDDLLEDAGAKPSSTRQLDQEFSMEKLPRKRGRPSKAVMKARAAAAEQEKLRPR